MLGPGGGRGATGRGGGNSANPGFSSIALVGTDLVFTRDTAGPLGPDITVDLSGLTGGFAGLGIWRYRTNTGTSPTSGRLNFNNVDPELATELYINETNDGGEDLANFLALLESGDVLYIQDKGNANNFILVEVDTNTDNGSDITIGIANVNAQGAAISNNAQVNLVMSVAGGGGGGGGDPWHEFTPQSSNPGTIAANTLWQDDGSNYDAGSLIWGDLSNPMVFSGDVSIGDPGTEQGGVNVGGVNFDAITKINNYGSSIDAELILHRHSTTDASALAFSRSNSNDTTHGALTPGQVISTQAHLGWSGSHYDLGAYVSVVVPPGSTVGPTSLAAEFQYYTSPDGSDTPLLAAIIGSDQVIYGGQVAGASLDLQGAARSAPDVGLLRANSPVTFTYDTFSNTTPAQQFVLNWDSNPQITSNYIGGMLSTAAVFDVSTAVFIPAIFSDTNRYNVGAAPGFSAITFINELSVIANDGNFNLPSALVINVGLTHERNTSGTSTTPGTTGLSFSPGHRTTVSGAVMTKTSQTAVRCSPTFSTVAGSTANLGVIRGLHCFNPAVGLFQPQAGVETMTAYYGVDVNAIPFGGNVVKAAVRSAIAAATNARFLLNIGTAQSDFGNGDVHLNDNNYMMYGGTVANPDVIIGWDTGQAGMVWSSFFGVGGNPLYLRPTAADEWTFQQNNGGALDIGLGFNVNAIVFGTTAPTPNSNNWFVQFAGPNQRQVQINGEYSDVLWTASGSIDVDGNTVSDLQAFKINSPSVLLNGGTIDDISNLYVAAMPSFGATRTQALRVLGRGRIDGHINQGSQEPAQLTGNTNDWQLAANNGQRGVVLMDSDGAYNVTGIDASFGFAQTGDILNILNISAFTITFTHQDVLSLAANRFITATGAGIAVAAGETIRLWYDDTGTLRWRHIRLQ